MIEGPIDVFPAPRPEGVNCYFDDEGNIVIVTDDGRVLSTLQPEPAT